MEEKRSCGEMGNMRVLIIAYYYLYIDRKTGRKTKELKS